ncbi:hypothetical protein IAT40_005427 [Kwoniella sp. CBS 6097]
MDRNSFSAPSGSGSSRQRSNLPSGAIASHNHHQFTDDYYGTYPADTTRHAHNPPSAPPYAANPNQQSYPLVPQPRYDQVPASAQSAAFWSTTRSQQYPTGGQADSAPVTYLPPTSEHIQNSSQLGPPEQATHWNYPSHPYGFEPLYNQPPSTVQSTDFFGNAQTQQYLPEADAHFAPETYVMPTDGGTQLFSLPVPAAGCSDQNPSATTHDPSAAIHLTAQAQHDIKRLFGRQKFENWLDANEFVRIKQETAPGTESNDGLRVKLLLSCAKDRKPHDASIFTDWKALWDSEYNKMAAETKNDYEVWKANPDTEYIQRFASIVTLADAEALAEMEAQKPATYLVKYLGRTIQILDRSRTQSIKSGLEIDQESLVKALSSPWVDKLKKEVRGIVLGPRTEVAASQEGQWSDCNPCDTAAALQYLQAQDDLHLYP